MIKSVAMINFLFIILIIEGLYLLYDNSAEISRPIALIIPK